MAKFDNKVFNEGDWQGIHIHDFVEHVEFANTEDVCTRITKTCKNCDEEEIVENPHPSFHIIEEGIFDDVYGCDNKGCPYQYVEPKNRD